VLISKSIKRVIILALIKTSANKTNEEGKSLGAEGKVLRAEVGSFGKMMLDAGWMLDT